MWIRQIKQLTYSRHSDLRSDVQYDRPEKQRVAVVAARAREVHDV